MANATRHDENDVKMNKREVVVRLLKYLKGHVLEIVLTLLAMGGAVAISLINPLIMEKAVDEYIPSKDTSHSLGRHAWNTFLFRNDISNLPIGHGLSEGYRQHHFPHRFAECCRLHPQLRRESRRLTAEINSQPPVCLVKNRQAFCFVL